MGIPINLLVSGSTLVVSGDLSAGAKMQIDVPLSAPSFTTTGSIVANDLYVSGTLTAREMKTILVSSSIIHESGSTKFGDTVDDTHEFTGSLKVIGGNISGSFVGSVVADGGLSGSLQRLTTGQTYLAASGSVTIVTQSNGQVIIGADAADPNVSYVVMTTTSSLSNERALAAGSGLSLADGGAGSNATLSINDNVVATVSGTQFTGPVVATTGLSGSLQQTATGLSYLVAGANISIASQSNGQVIVSTIDGGNDWIDGGAKLKTTSSVSIDGQDRYADALGTDVYFFVSGTIGVESGSLNARKIAAFGGDVVITGSLTVGSSSVKVTSNDVQFGSDIRIERSGGGLQAVVGSNGLRINNGTSVASIGIIRLPNNVSVAARDAADNADLTLMTVSAANAVTFGNTTGATTIDAGTAGLNIATSADARSVNIATGAAAQTVTIGSTNGGSSTTIQCGTGNFLATGAAASTYTIGDTNTTGQITIGQSAASNTVKIGGGASASNVTQTIILGSNGAGTSEHAITIGNYSSTPQSSLRLLTDKLSFFSLTTPVTKQTVSGSRGDNAALASLLTALSSYGLITDSTS